MSKTYLLNHNNHLKHIIFICLSYALAAFDFLIYIHLADVIGTVFFPDNHSHFVNQLQVIGLVSVGFLSRPIGAALIGRYGDINGRKPALLISISLLSITTLLAVFLPTYAQVGIAAPVLFLFIRILQGVAFGAHAPLSWVYIAEHAPRHWLATYCSLAVAGGIFGSVVSVISAKFLTGSLDSQAMLSYGWRIPALIGGVLSFLVLFLWRRIEETPVYNDYLNNRTHKPDLLSIEPYVNRSSAIILSTALSFVRASLIMVVMLLLPKLIALKFYTEPSFLMNASLLALLMQIVGCILYGFLADKIGTGKTFMLSTVVFVVQMWVFYLYLANGHGLNVLSMYGLFGFSTGMIGLCVAIFVQVFPTNIRLSSVSVIYNSISALVGAILPIALFRATAYISVAPALYLTFIGIIAFVIGLHLHQRERFGELYTSFRKPKRYEL